MDNIIKIDVLSRKVTLNKKVLGISGENKIDRLIFKLDEFIYAKAILEIQRADEKYFIMLDKEDDTYVLEIKNSLLSKTGTIDMQFVLIQEDNVVFKSNLFEMYVKEAINATVSIDDEYKNVINELLELEIKMIKAEETREHNEEDRQNYIADLKIRAEDKIEEMEFLSNDISESELVRQMAENERIIDESTRKSNELTRQQNEQQRILSESIREYNETERQNYINDLKVKVNNGEFKGEKGDTGEKGEEGIDGENGATFIPYLDSDGNLSWSNDKGLENPQTINIKGQKGDTGDKGEKGLQGEKGEDGADGQNGINGVDGKDGATFIPNVDEEGNLSWTNNKGLDNPTEVNIKGQKGDNGENGAKGEEGRGITNITKKSSEGLIDTYTINFSDNTNTEFQVTNGKDGEGSGDMAKAVYDTNNNGIVDNAEKVNGHTVDIDVPVNALFTDTTYGVATEFENGLMSANDKAKLDNTYTKTEVDNIIKSTIKGYKKMTAIIDLSNSNPATCITYADDAVDMTAGDSAWDEFFGHYPVLLKNGVEVGKLNPNNFDQFEDGTTADISSGDAGDAMIAFPRRGLKITTSGTKITISMTNDPNNADFEYNAHTRGTTPKDVFYLGVYKGYVASNKLRSLKGQNITASQTIGTFRTQAQANGDGYEQSGFYQLTFRQCMYILKYKNLNSQTAVGYGYVLSSHSAAIASGGTETWGMDCELIKETNPSYMTDQNHHVKCFGIEDFWGNIWEWIDGLVSDSSRNVLTANSNFNDSGSGYVNNGNGGVTSNIGNYMSKPQGSTKAGFVATEVSGSETTYFCDYANFSDSCVSVFGGNWNNTAITGAFRLSVGAASSYSVVHIASRLMYL